MENLGGIVFSVLVTMGVLLVVWLAMGKRQVGELSPFDFVISITAGTIAGAGIADPRIELGRVVGALIALGALQIVVSYLTLKYRSVYSTIHHEPTVIVENGQMIKANLRKVRLPVETVLNLLREKDVFDITEVELAIFEPTGKLSVLRKAESMPVTPSQLNMAVPPNRILVPVVLEGELQEKVLRGMGFSQEQVQQLRADYGDRLGKVFVAFMDKGRQMHVVEEEVPETGMFLH